MENYNQESSYLSSSKSNQDIEIGSQSVARKFIANVFLWMFAALGISAFCAYYFATSPELIQLLVSETGLTTIGYIVMFAPLGFVLLMSFGFHKLPAPLITVLFVVYAAITGISLSFILLAYTATSVLGCFASSAAMFGVMAFMGYTTDKDLTSFGRILTMGLIGIVIASVINIWLRSDAMGYIVSIIGVMVFTGLTAYDVQKLKRIGEGIEYEGTSTADIRKLSIMGALTLYLDFINLFLMLLRLFGGKRD
jgi:FtsH-binding integral membrane protein